MTDFDKIAHLIRFGLLFRKMTTDTITEWADQKINEGTDNDFFFDLSLAGTTNSIIDLLSTKVAWDYNNGEIRNLLLSYYREYLKANSAKWFDIEKELLEYFYLLEFNDSNERSQDFLYSLDVDWHLRENGFLGSLPMPTYVTESLDEFKDYDKLNDLLKGQGLVGYNV